MTQRLWQKVEDAAINWKWLELNAMIVCPCGLSVTTYGEVVTCTCGREYRCRVLIEKAEARRA